MLQENHFSSIMIKKDKKEKKTIKYQAPALEKGLEILEYLSQRATPLSQSEIANGIHKTPNEIYRMLACLEEKGYLIREEISGKYKISLKLYHLSHQHSPVDEIRRTAQYPLDDLAKAIRQSCHLSVLYHYNVMVICQSRSPVPIALSIEEGSLFPLFKTASGKILLSFMSEQGREEVLKRDLDFNSYPPSKQKKIIRLLNEIQKKGYYVTPSELTLGITDISFPMIGENNTNAIASLTISVLSTQMNEEVTFEKIISQAQDTVDKIMANLGLRTFNLS